MNRPARDVTPLPKQPKRTKAQRGMYGVGAKGKATKLHAELVRARGACERCGSTRNLQCAHIVGRLFSATRTDENNAWCLCATCHHFLTQWPHEHVAFAYRTHGEAGFKALCEKARSNPRPWKQAQWEAECERLSGLLAVLGKNH